MTLPDQQPVSGANMLGASHGKDCDMRALIEFIAHNLVEYPEKVYVQELAGPRANLYRLRVAPEDVGRIIGKGGAVANAIRTVVRVAAEKKGERAILEID